ncbi:YihY family inner membrane protein [Sediminibacillus dalangtanensis]|uniref:YihY family inner membrane protein n=1 Tax=Sediminibacillus dalangtanensis TaxID=2729421 RepID=A0ABX7VNB1_9BACI|nr:YihY/virulence factor BrkB family protein [Sediminibacillus dalangtanensis]QTM98327.1 YihY family inner membrane protein [Sediminibacillus dalangtanensis]
MGELIQFVIRLIKRILDDDVGGMAAQLAFFFLLSLFPFLLFLITLIGYLPLTQLDIMRFVSLYAPEETFNLINENLSGIAESRNGRLLSVTILATLWTASNGINAIIRSLNAAYNVEENRSFIVSRLIAVVLTVAMVSVIAVAFLLPIFGKTIGIYLFSFFGLSSDFLQLWNALRWLISFVVFFIVLLALYKMAPNRKVFFKDAAVGAAFATLGWQLVSLAFSYYVDNMGSYSAVYGSLGTVIVLMIWFYLSGMVIIAGGEINALYEKFRLKKYHQ